MLREGEKIKIDGKTGRIIYVNRLIKCYQVMFDEGHGQLVPFDKVEKEKAAT